MSEQKQAAPVGKRPKCLQCGRALKPNYSYPRLPYPTDGNWKDYKRREREGRTWRGSYGPLSGDKFCTNECAIRWALAHAKR